MYRENEHRRLTAFQRMSSLIEFAENRDAGVLAFAGPMILDAQRMGFASRKSHASPGSGIDAAPTARVALSSMCGLIG